MIKAKRTWDPLYGRIELTDFEFDLISLPEVQRLRYVRMCNINSLLVAGASEISRFEHTLGVMHLAQQWIKAHGLPESEGKDLVAAAVLHDIQTGPFGHWMQYVLEDNTVEEATFIHGDLSHGWRSAYHQNTLASSSFSGKPFRGPAFLSGRWETVASLIRGEGKHGPLIAGTMDLDNIDNVVRLAYHVGVTEEADRSIPLTLAHRMSIDRGELVLQANATPAVVRWQEIRSRLYDLLLHDWAEFSAKAMLTKAIEVAISYDLVGADSWVMTDSGFLDFLEQKGVGEAQEVREYVRRLRRGDLYEPVALYESPAVEKYVSLSSTEVKLSIESGLSLALKGRGIKPLVHFILDKGKTRRGIKVRLAETGERLTIGETSSRLLAGLFVSSSRLSDSDRQALDYEFRSILINEHVVFDIVPIPDPMGALPPGAQLSLI